MDLEAIDEYSQVIRERHPIIPTYMLDGISCYVLYGIRPGSFLEAVFSNDLRGAFERADHNNSHIIREYLMLAYSTLPANCWGSVKQFEEWLKSGGLIEMEKKLAPAIDTVSTTV